MRHNSVRFIILPFMSLVGLLAGCGPFPTTASSGPSKIPSSNPAARVTATQQTHPIEIATIHQSSSQMSFTFNQPISDFHILSGETTLFEGKTNDSTTFLRSPSANTVISVLVTAGSGDVECVFQPK